MKHTFEMCRRIDQIINNGGDIYIRCAGYVGRQICYELKQMGIRVKAFLDRDTSIDVSYLGVPIYSPEYVYDLERGTYFVIIAIKDNTVYKKICDDYNEHGLSPDIDYGDFTFTDNSRIRNFMDIPTPFGNEEIFRKRSAGALKDMQNVDPDFTAEVPDSYNHVALLDVPLTTYCSLSCEYCSHCIPYAKPPKHFDQAKVAEYLDKFLSVCSVSCVGIMGGEPFVYPYITEFIRSYSKLKNLHNVGYTRIVTNGTVLPKDDFFTEYAKIPNSYIYISNYGVRSNKIKDITNKCDEYGIKHYVHPLTNDWLYLGDAMTKRDYTEEQLKHLFTVCNAHYCVQLYENKIYSCGRVPVLNEYGIIPYCETDFCDLSCEDTSELSEKIHTYLYQKPYLEGCKYCDGQHMFSPTIKRGS